MSALRRSTTGCTVCKVKRRKCDETKPQCLRCLSTGKSCVYDFVEYSANESHRIQRTKPGPRTSSRISAQSSKNDSNYPPNGDNSSSSSLVISGDFVGLAPGRWGYKIGPGLNHATSRNSAGSSSNPSISPVPSQLHSDLGSSYSSQTSPGLGLLPDDIIPSVYNSTLQASTIPDEDEDDSEELQVSLYKAPAVDKNLKENTLPFVLHCYSQWATVRVFESLKVVNAMRDQVISHFSFEKSRTRTILIANVMDMFARNLVIDRTRKSILNGLALDVQKGGSRFVASPPSSDPGLDKQTAMLVLDSMLEIFSLQGCTQSIAACLQLLDYAAPVFRRGCPESPGQPLSIPNLLLEPNSNLRHFAYLDIMMSISTGRPTYFQYEVPFSLELCQRIYDWQLQGNCGLQWLHGFPDQFFLVFAWINSLRDTPGASENAGLVAWIEDNLPRINVDIDESDDSLLRIRRMMAQECWRFAVLIYLYLVLCKVNVNDPRVIRAQKGFMRLVRGVRPARHPDVYLVTTLVITGVATIEEKDRDTLRQRILNVRESAERGTVGNDGMLMLEDVWARTKAEGRAAEWSDLGIACFGVTGR